MSITPSITLGSLNLTAAPFLWEFGSDFGGPEVVYETLLSMLRDGSSISSNRFENREFSLQVMIEAANFLQLAQYEALLVAECDKERNTLTFTPGDAFGPATVFDTFRVQATLVRNDDEEQAFVRRWSLTIAAAPAGRSAALTVTAAQPATPTYTLVDNGSSATGWSGTASGATVTGPTVVSGRVTLTVATGGTKATLNLIRTGSVNYSTAAFVAVDVASTAALSGTYFVVGSTTPGPGGGGTGLLAAGQIDLGGGLTRIFYTVPPGTGTQSGFYLQAGGSWAVGGTLAIDQVQTSDSMPFFGSAKQRVAALVPGGSVRTQGSIAVEHASSALGSTLVFTYPAGLGWVPPLRQWLTSSSTVSADATAVSGSSQPLTATSVYRVPASIQPTGSYIVMARMKVGSAATVVIHFDAYTYIGSTAVGLYSNSASIPLTTAYQMITLGRVTLPSTKVGPAGFAQLSIYRDGGSTVTLDEVYLFHESGDLTFVEAGTASPSAGGDSNRLWLDAPSLDTPQGGVWLGFAADRSDSRHAGPATMARPPYGHNLLPAGMNVFTVTSNADSAAVSSTHYRRWHTHAAT